MQFSNTPYGCHDRAPFKDNIDDPDIAENFNGDAYFYMRRIPFRGTKDCQYTLSNLGQIDPGCSGCKHKVTPAPVEEPKDFIVFRAYGDEPEQVSVPCTREAVDRFIKYKRIDQPEETFFILKIVKE